ncbi:MAG TPA: bifunctional glutamate N-acetyltransferase/amino-acid acetyltransferase ArgJ [Chloroflexota bacterium]|nr:bifunctional glutamate N-acetyltransferase/amino-acid acetyltransferase ArgJ [Chloroflexota bacterium]
MIATDFRVLADGGVTAAEGFLAGAVYAGLQLPAPDQRDLGVLLSERPCAAAARFTRNLVVAAPVIVSRRYLAAGRPMRGAVFNAGNANACTGPESLRAAEEMAALAAARFGVAAEELVVASTGVIGVPLDMAKVRDGIGRLEVSRDGGAAVARAIMTTDLVPKQAAVELELGGRTVRVGGMAKGSGMIHPDLATMLAFLTTDAPLTRQQADALLGPAVDVSFNMVTVDGDTSTNDMVLLLANGAAGGEPGALGAADLARLGEALEWVCVQLTRAIAADGEGATRLIEVRVEGARDVAEARRAAKTVAGSPLVKAAVYGADPNWGRILAALGRAGVALDPDAVDVAIGPVAVAAGGQMLPFDEAAARAALQPPEVRLYAHLHQGDGAATAWGCDLTEQYVRINSEYTT